MQRTFLSVSQGGNTTLSGSTFSGAAAGPFYCPISGQNMVAPLYTTPVGNGAYGQTAFSAVYSRLNMLIGKVANGTGLLVTGAVNVGGTTPAPGNLIVQNGTGVVTTLMAYYYDATDIDAVTAGQAVGFQASQGASATGIAVLSSMSVICDTLNQGFCSPFMFTGTTSGPAVTQLYQDNNHYAHTAGLMRLTNTITSGQDYAQQSFLATYLQWQICSGNADGATAVNCAFSQGQTFGSPTDTGLSATIPSAGYSGIIYDATDVSAVPAQSYFGLHWTGSTTNSNTIHLGNGSIHMQAAGNNTCWFGAGNTGEQSWGSGAQIYSCFGSTRFDTVFSEASSAVPTAGVFTGLATLIGTFTASATLTLYAAAGTDSGSGSGVVNNSTSAPPPSGTPGAPWSSTGLSTTGAASGWWYDATDIFAATNAEVIVVEAAAATAGAVTIIAQSMNFTAPAHLGLTTQGAG